MSYRRRLKKKSKETFLVSSASVIHEITGLSFKICPVSRMNCTRLGMLLTCLVNGLTYVFTSRAEFNYVSYLIVSGTNLLMCCIWFQTLDWGSQWTSWSKGCCRGKKSSLFFCLPWCRTSVHVVSLQSVCFYLDSYMSLLCHVWITFSWFGIQKCQFICWPFADKWNLVCYRWKLILSSRTSIGTHWPGKRYSPVAFINFICTIAFDEFYSFRSRYL